MRKGQCQWGCFSKKKGKIKKTFSRDRDHSEADCIGYKVEYFLFLERLLSLSLYSVFSFGHFIFFS